jgi:hypothetical protein
VLLVFEAWNLSIIALALVGFNYVATLATSPATPWAIWAAAIGTAGFTFSAVYAWTK